MGDSKADDSSGQGAYAFGPFVVDPLKRRLWREHALVPISSKTFDVLVVLLEHRDHSVSKDELLNLVWPDTAVNENNLARQISSLRRALGQRPDEHDFVVTIPGHGYRFVATVQRAGRACRPSCATASMVMPIIRRSRRWTSRSFPPAPSCCRCRTCPEACRRTVIPAGGPSCRGDGCRSGYSSRPSAPSSRSPWTSSCDTARVRRRPGAACSASPMRMRRCRGTWRGRRTGSGWCTPTTAPAMPTSGSSISAIPIRFA